MVETLIQKSCTPCKGGIPPLTEGEAQSLQAQVAKWELADDGAPHRTKFQVQEFRGGARVRAEGRGSWRREKGIIPTSASAGALRPCLSL